MYNLLFNGDLSSESLGGFLLCETDSRRLKSFRSCFSFKWDSGSCSPYRVCLLWRPGFLSIGTSEMALQLCDLFNLSASSHLSV